ncbi:hypothetical protein FWD07_02385 [Candidatus Saccharibacteria bacterium]|nr:hypothetical protein [Candidatus Saccharibacteria bacterium]
MSGKARKNRLKTILCVVAALVVVSGVTVYVLFRVGFIKFSSGEYRQGEGCERKNGMEYVVTGSDLGIGSSASWRVWVDRATGETCIDATSFGSAVDAESEPWTVVREITLTEEEMQELNRAVGSGGQECVDYLRSIGLSEVSRC